MARLTLVRHGRAAAAWDAEADPGLDQTGRAQAAAVADVLAPVGPLPIVVSPLRRTRETAEALERRWQTTARVEPAVGEIPSPDLDVAERGAWLAELMNGTWGDVEHELGGWRNGVIDALLGLRDDTVVVSHFVAINVAVGAALRDDRVVCFTPDNCSRTVLDVRDGRLEVVELGGQAVTVVQ